MRRGAVLTDVAHTSTLVATLAMRAMEGRERDAACGRCTAACRGRGGACLRDNRVIFAVRETTDKLIEGLHGVAVGGCVELGCVFDGDNPIKGVSKLKVIQDLHGAFEQFHILLLFGLYFCVNLVSGITAGAILLDTGDDVKGEGVLNEEVDRGGEGFLSVKEARLLRGERLRGVVHGCRA